MRDYTEIAGRLNRVRWAWRRTTMLSGFAVVVLEAIGVFAIAVLIDYLYEPLPATRVGLVVLALAIVFILLVRHVLTPLLRAIPDTQVALYVEERCPEFEGALLSASEFGRVTDLQSEQAAIIDAVLEQAVLRTRHIDLKQVLDLRRLHKYGVIAMALLAIFVIGGLIFPESFGHRAGRILKPWERTREDRAKLLHIAVMKQPIGFHLSQGDTRLLRGTPFVLETVLTRATNDPVNLHFRSLAREEGESAWRKLPMDDMDVVNGFQLTLPDINEDVEFFVATGKYRSSSHRITVYDPLEIEGIEVVTKYPDYLQLDPLTENTPSGDVSAPLDSTITVRILANAKLKQGNLIWEDGTKQPLTPDPERPTTAYATFKVAKDTTYGFAVEDIDAQAAESVGLAYVKALTDKPPAIELVFPKIDLAIHPLGEITFDARAQDDFGVAGVDLVYKRGVQEGAKDVRIPLKLSEPKTEDAKEEQTPLVGEKRATLLMALEDIRPTIEPGEVFTYHLECRDRKGQKAVTDVFFLTIGNFEVWATWRPELGHGGTHAQIFLGPFLAAAWNLHLQKENLPEAEFQGQCSELAESMTDPETGALYEFVDMRKVPPDKIEHAKRAIAYIEQGHKTLVKYDTDTTLEKWRVAMGELALLGLSDSSSVLVSGEGDGMMEGEEERSLSQIAFMEQARLDATNPESNRKLVMPEYRRKLLEAEEAERLQKEVEKQEEEQEKLTEEAKELQAQLDPENPEMQPKPMPEHQKKALEQKAENLAEKQKKQADATRKVAEEMKKHEAAQDPKLKRAAEKIDQAAREMQKAAKELKKKEMPKAVATMQRAQKELADAKKQLKGVHQEKLERALNLAEMHTEKLLEEQRQVRKETEKTAEKQAPEKKLDAKQERDLKKLAHEQARLRKDFDEVKKNVEKLREWSGETNKRETAEHVEQAERTLRRSQVQQKMTNALVELAKKQAAKAAPEQKKAEDGLEKTLQQIRKANDSLAADRESELRRAKREAEHIEKALERLGPKQQTAAKPKPDPDKKDADKKDEEAKPKPKPKPLNTRERKELAENLKFEVKRLTKHLERREFAEKKDREFLKKRTEDLERLSRNLQQRDEERKKMLDVVARVRDRLEKEIESSLQAKKLFAAQREECPPQYRAMVNKYYEALSTGTAK